MAALSTRSNISGTLIAFNLPIMAMSLYVYSQKIGLIDLHPNDSTSTSEKTTQDSWYSKSVLKLSQQSAEHSKWPRWFYVVLSDHCFRFHLRRK
jgi:hypothetical protein